MWEPRIVLLKYIHVLIFFYIYFLDCVIVELLKCVIKFLRLEMLGKAACL